MNLSYRLGVAKHVRTKEYLEHVNNSQSSPIETQKANEKICEIYKLTLPSKKHQNGK